MFKQLFISDIKRWLGRCAKVGSCLSFLWLSLPVVAVDFSLSESATIEISTLCPSGGYASHAPSEHGVYSNSQAASYIYSMTSYRTCSANQTGGINITTADIQLLIDNAEWGDVITVRDNSGGTAPNGWVSIFIKSGCNTPLGQNAAWRTGTVSTYVDNIVTPSFAIVPQLCVSSCVVDLLSVIGIFTDTATISTFGPGSPLYVFYETQKTGAVCYPAGPVTPADPYPGYGISEVATPQGGDVCVDVDPADFFDDNDGSLCVLACEDNDQDGFDDDTGLLCGRDQYLDFTKDLGDLGRGLSNDDYSLWDLGDHLPASLILPVQLKDFLNGSGECFVGLGTVADIDLGQIDACAIKAEYEGIFTFALWCFTVFVSMSAYRFALS